MQRLTLPAVVSVDRANHVHIAERIADLPHHHPKPASLHATHRKETISGDDYVLTHRYLSQVSMYLTSLCSRLFDRIAESLHIAQVDDWYTKRREDIVAHGGGSALTNYYSNSYVKALAAVYAETHWHPWRFVQAPSGIWKDHSLHVKFLDWLAEQFNVEKHEDWYSKTKEDVINYGGAEMLNIYYEGSLSKALMTVYATINWQAWRFAEVPRGFWKDTQHHRQFLEWLGEELGIDEPQDWLDVTFDDISKHGGLGMLASYDNDHMRAVQVVFPEVHWDSASPPNWSQYDRNFIEIAHLMELASPDAWYNLSPRDLADYGEFLTVFDNSLCKALQCVFPETEWQPWKFVKSPQTMLQDTKYHRQFFDWLAEELGVEEQDDWYSVSREDIVKHGGGNLLVSCYSNSHMKALPSIYPELEWHPWKFPQVPPGYWMDFANHKKYFDWLGKELGMNSYEDWYSITRELIMEHCGGGLLANQYRNCFRTALQTVYPEYSWQPWRFVQITNEVWQQQQHQKEYFDWLASKLGIKTLEDWYKIYPETIAKNGGQGLLFLYGGSHIEALAVAYPYLQWQTWRFEFVNVDYWNDPKNLRKYFDWVGEQLIVQTPTDWYNITKEDVFSCGGTTLFDHELYSSLPKALAAAYPDVAWQPWKFSTETEVKYHHLVLEWLAQRLRIRVPEDWYDVNMDDISSAGGRDLLKDYDSSLFKSLETVFPEYSWLPWKFLKVQHNCWLDIKHQRKFFDWYASTVGLHSTSDWYTVNKLSIIDHGGGTLLNLHEGSHSKAIISVYPEVQWFPELFECYHPHQRLLKELEKQLAINSPRDWYGVTTQQVLSHDNGGILLNKVGGSLPNLLKVYYPKYDWDLRYWTSTFTNKQQQFLVRALKTLLPNLEVEWDIHIFHKQGLEMDVWLPSLNVAIEYQGRQHYLDNSFVHGEQGVTSQYLRDLEKRRICDACGIKLLQVPFWWDSTIVTLGNTLAKDLGINGYEDANNVIPKQYPFNLHQSSNSFALGNNPQFQAAEGHNWNTTIDITEWMCSVHTNRVRVLTDGKGSFYSQTGTMFFPPEEFVQSLSCGIVLDLLLWIEWESPQSVVSMLHRAFKPEMSGTRWEKVNVLVVDAPECLGDITERLNIVKYHLLHEKTKIANYWKVHDPTAIFSWRNDENSHIAGLELRDSRCGYLQGKSLSLLQIKVCRVENGIVIKHHASKCYVEVQLSNGARIWVNTRLTRAKQMENVRIDSQVKVFYFEKDANGNPKTPCLLHDHKHDAKNKRSFYGL